MTIDDIEDINDLFDEKGKRYSATPISDECAENMLSLIKQLQAELERERELRMELVEDVKNKTITEVLDLLPKYQNAFILENDYAYLKLDISRKRTA